jgi:hypothetical protein
VQGLVSALSTPAADPKTKHEGQNF